MVCRNDGKQNHIIIRAYNRYVILVVETTCMYIHTTSYTIHAVGSGTYICFTPRVTKKTHIPNILGFVTCKIVLVLVNNPDSLLSQIFFYQYSTS